MSANRLKVGHFIARNARTPTAARKLSRNAYRELWRQVCIVRRIEITSYRPKKKLFIASRVRNFNDPSDMCNHRGVPFYSRVVRVFFVPTYIHMHIYVVITQRFVSLFGWKPDYYIRESFIRFSFITTTHVSRVVCIVVVAVPGRHFLALNIIQEPWKIVNSVN